MAALRKLPAEIKPVVMRIMASYAFEDYARSAASKKQCPCCYGEKFIESIVFTNKVQYPDGKPPVWAKCTKGVYPSYWEEWKKVSVWIFAGTKKKIGRVEGFCMVAFYAAYAIYIIIR